MCEFESGGVNSVMLSAIDKCRELLKSARSISRRHRFHCTQDACFYVHLFTHNIHPLSVKETRHDNDLDLFQNTP